MQISNHLPQFNNETALLVVTGKQDAVFYIATDGQLYQVESFQVEKPQYDDVEGHFESKAKTAKHGQTMRAGSPYEPTDKDEKAVSTFLKELTEELESVKKHHELDKLYVFTPPHMKNEVDEHIPYPLGSQEEMVIDGNYFDTHPFKLLERIQKQAHKEPVRPIKEAAQKILNKFKR